MKAIVKAIYQVMVQVLRTNFEDHKRKPIRTLHSLNIKLRAKKSQLEINKLRGKDGGGIAPESFTIELEAKV